MDQIRQGVIEELCRIRRRNWKARWIQQANLRQQRSLIPIDMLMSYFAVHDTNNHYHGNLNRQVCRRNTRLNRRDFYPGDIARHGIAIGDPGCLL